MNKKTIIISLILLIVLLTISFPALASEPEYEIDQSKIDTGIVLIKYSSTDNVMHKLKIKKGDDVIYYTLRNNIKDSFSLTFGNGEYEIRIMQNTTGNSYKTVYRTNVTLNIGSSSDVYLASIQNVNWTENMDSINYADKIIEETYESLLQKVKMYELIIFNYSYDYDKYSNIKSSFYLPIIDDTYKVQQGICYDFSALLAGMFRSQGIPTKLVKGYASYSPDVYHAWNEILINGKWYIIDTTYDAYYVKRGVEVIMLKPLTNYKKVYEY